jgi:hypothetical protein
MGFKDWFVDENTGNTSVKVQCTGCQRITVVKIPSNKTFEKWNEKAKCSQCDAKKCWNKVE